MYDFLNCFVCISCHSWIINCYEWNFAFKLSKIQKFKVSCVWRRDVLTVQKSFCDQNHYQFYKILKSLLSAFLLFQILKCSYILWFSLFSMLNKVPDGNLLYDVLNNKTKTIHCWNDKTSTLLLLHQIIIIIGNNLICIF